MEGFSNRKLEYLSSVIDKSQYLVCLMGVKVSSEYGCTNYRDENDAYEIEAKYGYSPEEMFCSSFYNTRVDQFYQFYKADMIRELGTVNEDMGVLKRMEDSGKLKAIVTRDIFSLARRVGCRNVYELHGSVFDNKCPHCGRKYPVEYIQNSKGVPRCESCGTVIRPGVTMVGEMVDNALISKAAAEVKQADTLLVLGCNLKSALTDTFLRYFEGRELVLIHEKEHYADKKADLVIYGKPMDILNGLGI
jgi:NAD-dependent deacetylase